MFNNKLYISSYVGIYWFDSNISFVTEWFRNYIFVKTDINVLFYLSLQSWLAVRNWFEFLLSMVAKNKYIDLQIWNKSSLFYQWKWNSFLVT